MCWAPSLPRAISGTAAERFARAADAVPAIRAHFEAGRPTYIAAFGQVIVLGWALRARNEVLVERLEPSAAARTDIFRLVSFTGLHAPAEYAAIRITEALRNALAAAGAGVGQAAPIHAAHRVACGARVRVAINDCRVGTPALRRGGRARAGRKCREEN